MAWATMPGMPGTSVQSVRVADDVAELSATGHVQARPRLHAAVHTMQTLSTHSYPLHRLSAHHD